MRHSIRAADSSTRSLTSSGGDRRSPRRTQGTLRWLRGGVVGLIALLGLAAAMPAWAADYPTRPIRIVSPYPPGGGNDIIARIIAEALGNRLGQSVIVDNRAGAGGVIGTDYVLKSAPDGYTLLLASMDTLTIVPALKADMPYKIPDDVTYLARIAENGITFSISPKLPVSTMADFIAYAKANPGKVRFGSSGLGSAPQMAVELFKQQAGVDMLHIPYKGINNALTDLLGGRIELVPLTPVAAAGYLKSDALRIIAFTGPERHPSIPNVPTLAELGMPKATVTIWYSLVGPANMPPGVVERLHRELEAALGDPAVRTKFERTGLTVAPLYGDDFRNLVVKELEQWRAIGRAQKIELE
jgi:tripartite-type tricarboxylate transporter receptor subunit TctC